MGALETTAKTGKTKRATGHDRPSDRQSVDVYETHDLNTFRVIEVSSTFKIEGRSIQENSNPNDSIWQLRRVVLNGSGEEIYYDFASDEANGKDYGSFSFSLTDWKNEFASNPIEEINVSSVLLDGTNDFISVPTDASLDFDGTSAFSMSCWAKRSGPAALDVLLTKIGATFNGYIFGAADTFAQIFLINQLGVNEIQKTFTLPVVAGTSWHHYCFTYDGSQTAAGCKFYYDGTEVTNSTVLIDALSLTISNPSALGIGGVSIVPTLVPWAGNIDEPSLWSTELSSSVVSEIYNDGVPTDLLNSSEEQNNGTLISWWRNGDGDTAPTITDNKGSNDGTLTNGAAIVGDAP